MKANLVARSLSFAFAIALAAGVSAEPSREELLKQLKDIRTTLADDKTGSTDRVELAIAALDRTIGSLKEDDASTSAGTSGGSILSKSVQDRAGKNMDDDFFGVPGMPSWGTNNLQQMQQMREMMDRMMEDQVRQFDKNATGGLVAPGAVSPNADITEDGDNYVVRIDVPGADKGKIKVDVHGRVLRVSGERNEEVREEGADGHVIRQERRVGSFQRSIPLPGTVKDDKVQAKYENGVLVITLPKSGDSDADSHTITVQ